MPFSLCIQVLGISNSSKLSKGDIHPLSLPMAQTTSHSLCPWGLFRFGYQIADQWTGMNSHGILTETQLWTGHPWHFTDELHIHITCYTSLASTLLRIIVCTSLSALYHFTRTEGTWLCELIVQEMCSKI